MTCSSFGRVHARENDVYYYEAESVHESESRSEDEISRETARFCSYDNKNTVNGIGTHHYGATSYSHSEYENTSPTENGYDSTHSSTTATSSSNTEYAFGFGWKSPARSALHSKETRRSASTLHTATSTDEQSERRGTTEVRAVDAVFAGEYGTQIETWKSSSTKASYWRRPPSQDSGFQYDDDYETARFWSGTTRNVSPSGTTTTTHSGGTFHAVEHWRQERSNSPAWRIDDNHTTRSAIAAPAELGAPAGSVLYAYSKREFADDSAGDVGGVVFPYTIITTKYGLCDPADQMDPWTAVDGYDLPPDPEGAVYTFATETQDRRSETQDNVWLQGAVARKPLEATATRTAPRRAQNETLAVHNSSGSERRTANEILDDVFAQGKTPTARSGLNISHRDIRGSIQAGAFIVAGYEGLAMALEEIAWEIGTAGFGRGARVTVEVVAEGWGIFRRSRIIVRAGEKVFEVSEKAIEAYREAEKKLGVTPSSDNAIARAIAGRLSASGSQKIVWGPLSHGEKSRCRSAARALWESIMKYKAADSRMQVHHRIPLEYSHLFPYAHPNRRANLVALGRTVHTAVNNSWTAFRKGLGGRQPTQAEVMAKAMEIDKTIIEPAYEAWKAARQKIRDVSPANGAIFL